MPYYIKLKQTVNIMMYSHSFAAIEKRNSYNMNICE